MKRNIILILVVLLGLSWYTAVSETINNPKKKEAHLEKAEKLENAYLQSGDSGKFVSVCQGVA